MSKLRANSYSTKICCAGQTKLCLQDNFVAEDNSNYVKDNYDVELLQWSNKIIKDSFTYLPPGKNHFFIFNKNNAILHKYKNFRSITPLQNKD